MSMGNFMGVVGVASIEMATNQHPTHDAASADDSTDGAGMAHLTVVPTNFDPDAPSQRRD
ncbi:hypothetical protein [Natronosalvus halobius]|uniref:hypothetical protein n=1 Tax=Natronosalvus halobius TaxID=2953746 RepID=UPI0020A145EA|nr:hypothetical protein [Natronosalvus halobius]USZ73481.1 hypothetical protein NGM15_04250 [Natronosalvus halobius]